tara:strand:- start:410 stop:898 length:489 start_codon:yes stop_codon:yes gene_type:complete
MDGNTFTAGALYTPTNVTVSGNKFDATYSSGTFTPILANLNQPDHSSPQIAYNSQTGSYIKIGQLVHIWINIQFNSLDTSDTSGFTIGGLPFTHDVDEAIIGLNSLGSTGIGNKETILGAVFSENTNLTLTDGTGDNNSFLYSESGVASGIVALAFSYKANY